MRVPEGVFLGSVRSVSRPRFLGQATTTPPPPPRSEPGPARKLAALFLTDVPDLLSMRPRDPGKLYPGRMLLSPGDPLSLYVMSARKPAAGKIVLYAIEGPSIGNWKEYPLDEVRRTFRAVSENEGAVIRNLTSVHLPPGLDERRLDIIYPISLLSNAAVTITTTIPVSGAIDPAKAKEIYEDAVDGIILAAGLAIEALDAAGAQYDTLSVGLNAYTLVASTAKLMLAGLAGIWSALSAYPKEGAAALARASARVGDLSSNFPLWGLYLERAYLWTQLTDLQEMTSFPEAAISIEGALEAVLERISTHRDALLRLGISPKDLENVAEFASGSIKRGREVELELNAGIQSYLRENEISYGDLKLSAGLIGRLLEKNAEDIKLYQAPVPSPGAVSGLNGLGFLAAGGGRTPPRNVNLIKRMKENIRAQTFIQRSLEHARELLPKGAMDFYNFLTADIRKVEAVAKELEKAGKVEVDIKKVVAHLRAASKRLNKEVEKLEKEQKPIPPDLARQRYDTETALRVAESDAMALDAQILQRFRMMEEEFRKHSLKMTITKDLDEFASAVGDIMELIVRPKHKVFFTDFKNPSQYLDALLVVKDLQRSANFEPIVLWGVLETAIRFSGPLGKRRTKEDTARVISGMLKEGEKQAATRAKFLESVLQSKEYMEKLRDGWYFELDPVVEPAELVLRKRKPGGAIVTEFVPDEIAKRVMPRFTEFEDFGRLVDTLKSIQMGATSRAIPVVPPDRPLAKKDFQVVKESVAEIKRDAQRKKAKAARKKKEQAEKPAETTPEERRAADELEAAAKEQEAAAAELEPVVMSEADFERGVVRRSPSYVEFMRRGEEARTKSDMADTKLEVLSFLKKRRRAAARFFDRPKKTQNKGRRRAAQAKFIAELEKTEVPKKVSSPRTLLYILGVLGLLTLLGIFAGLNRDPKADDPLPKPTDGKDYLKIALLIGLVGIGIAFILKQVKKAEAGA